MKLNNEKIYNNVRKGFKYELHHSEDIISHNVESQRPIYMAQINKSNKSDLNQINWFKSDKSDLLIFQKNHEICQPCRFENFD